MTNYRLEAFLDEDGVLQIKETGENFKVMEIIGILETVKQRVVNRVILKSTKESSKKE